MGTVIQWIIVGFVVGAAVVYFIKRKKGDDCCNCPHSNTCGKKQRKK